MKNQTRSDPKSEPRAIHSVVRSALLCLSLLVAPELIRAAEENCPAPAGAVSWWRAENEALDSAGTNHATLEGGATFAPGKVGQAFLLDGVDDFVQVHAATGLPVLPIGNSPRTLALWFKTPRNLSVETEAGLANYGSAAENQMFGLITSRNAPGKLYFYAVGWPHNDFAGITTLEPNTWYHGAVTYDGSTVRLYLNGQLEATRSNATLNTVINSNGLTIGNREAVGFWNGLLDEIYIFNRALSARQIAELHAAGAAGVCFIDYPHPWIRVSEVEICWESWSNALYQVDYLSELTTNQWVPLYTNVIGNGLVMCVSDAVVLPQRFYRVVDATNQMPR